MHDNKSQWFIQVFCGVLTAFALFIPMPAMVFARATGVPAGIRAGCAGIRVI